MEWKKMKITAVRLRRVRGTMRTDGPFWEDRLVQPIDIYPEYRSRFEPQGGKQIDAHRFQITSPFVQIYTDDGVIGIGGPMPDAVASIIAGQLRPILMGKDPVASEKLWDQMH